jgi:hypothetical protein
MRDGSKRILAGSASVHDQQTSAGKRSSRLPGVTINLFAIRRSTVVKHDRPGEFFRAIDRRPASAPVVWRSTRRGRRWLERILFEVEHQC